MRVGESEEVGPAVGGKIPAGVPEEDARPFLHADVKRKERARDLSRRKTTEEESVLFRKLSRTACVNNY